MDLLDSLNDKDLILLYGKLLKELRHRKIIRTKNVVGDLGERFAIDHYTNSEVLESLTDAPPSSKSIDAIGNYGNRYAIKSVTGSVTGVFYGLPHKNSMENPTKLFDFLIIVVFSDNYELKNMYELTWLQFLKHRTWHSRMEAWNIPVNKSVKNEALAIFTQ
jgi:hypothetical protein